MALHAWLRARVCSQTYRRDIRLADPRHLPRTQAREERGRPLRRGEQRMRARTGALGYQVRPAGSSLEGECASVAQAVKDWGGSGSRRMGAG